MTNHTELKLSILIPVYNWDISQLIHGLINEIIGKNLSNQVELILIDDCSTDVEVKYSNNKLIRQLNLNCIKYSEMNKNLGRVAVRNLLAEKSSDHFFLFLDSDVLPDRADFITQYLFYCDTDEYDVICGGISYKQRIMKGQEFDFYVYLSYKSGIKNAFERNKVSWRSIFTSNILIRKVVFFDTPFDDRFIGYGYEDSEWGIRLVNKYKVLHIDNPVSHLGLVSKSNIYKRMRGSIKNYYLLSVLHPQAFRESDIARYVRLLKCLNIHSLRMIDSILNKLFCLISNQSISYILFQANKAILLALDVKANHVDTSRTTTIVKKG